MKFFVVLASLFAAAQAQFFGAPSPGATIQAGKNVTVQVFVPIDTTLEWRSGPAGQDEVSLVIGIVACGSSACPAASADLGEILFIGKYQSHGLIGNTLNSFENFSFVVPSDISGSASIQAQHVFLTTPPGHAIPSVDYESVADLQFRFLQVLQVRNPWTSTLMAITLNVWVFLEERMQMAWLLISLIVTGLTPRNGSGTVMHWLQSTLLMNLNGVLMLVLILNGSRWRYGNASPVYRNKLGHLTPHLVLSNWLLQTFAWILRTGSIPTKTSCRFGPVAEEIQTRSGLWLQPNWFLLLYSFIIVSYDGFDWTLDTDGLSSPIRFIHNKLVLVTLESLYLTTDLIEFFDTDGLSSSPIRFLVVGYTQ